MVSSRKSRVAVLLCLIALAVVLASPRTARGQTASVYAVDAENGKIYRVDFDAGTTHEVNHPDDASARGKLEGILVRDDGADGMHLVVCDSERGELLFYETTPEGSVFGQVITNAIARPEGVSAGPDGTLYLVSKKKVGGVGPEVWRIPRNCAGCVGGYGDPEPIDRNVPAEEIEDTKLDPSGDLLVVSEKPARVWRYPGAEPCADAFNCCGNGVLDCAGVREIFLDSGDSGAFPHEAEPNSLAFAPDGNLLIGTEIDEDDDHDTNSRILRFSPAGMALSDFYAGAELRDKLKLAAGPQDGESRVFVTSKKRPSVLRFKVKDDGQGSLLKEVTTPDTERPTGVSLSTGNAVATAASPDPQRLAPTSANELTLEEVTSSGYTNVRTIIFKDTRPYCGVGAPAFTLKALMENAGLDPEALLGPTQPNVVIPGYICSFLRDDAGTTEEVVGPVPTFLLNVVQTTAGLAKTFEHHVQEDELGFTDSALAPPSGLADYNQQPRLFYGVEAADPPIVEGTTFIDVSSGYGSNIGRGGETSLFLTGSDARRPKNIARFKLDQLKKALNSRTPASAGGLASFISNASPNRTLSSLKNLISAAQRALKKNDLVLAEATLQDFIDTVISRPGDFNNTTRNVSGELVARAESAAFMACGGTIECGRCLGPNPPGEHSNCPSQQQQQPPEPEAFLRAR